jgi:N6-L-threonylcarbamoyladenine synthase
VPVHHIEGHLFSPFLTDAPPSFPFLALIVSGGHTQLTWCPAPHRYEMLGATRDDAVGECFDKVARLLGLPYPGGPSIQKAAEAGDPDAFDFPRGLRGNDSLEFSYSGLKTAVLYAVRERPGLAQDDAARADLAASFQWAAVDALLTKTALAVEKTGAQRLVVAGGVAANALLRERLTNELGIPVHMPPLRLCLDNGAMIAAAAESLLRHGGATGLDVSAVPGLPLT